MVLLLRGRKNAKNEFIDVYWMEEALMEQNQKYKNFPIKKKLLISHGVIIALSVLIVTALLIGMGVIKNKLDGLYEG